MQQNFSRDLFYAAFVYNRSKEKEPWKQMLLKYNHIMSSTRYCTKRDTCLYDGERVLSVYYKYVLSTMDVSKESISKFLIGN